MEKNDALNILDQYQYYSIKDLRFNNKLGYLFSQSQLTYFLDLKNQLIEEGNDVFIELPLISFNSKHIFFTKGKYLSSKLQDYAAILNDYIIENNESLMSHNMDDIMSSRVFSEIEGTLRIENIPTTHKRIKEIYEKMPVIDRNDVIIDNMIKAMQYIVNEVPSFNKENLNRLYNILSNNCLDQEDKIKPGEYYRNDAVHIEEFDGAPYDQIDGMMDSLFNLVNNTKEDDEIYSFLPHICHYYILYVHPYFDYNGRTARMVSFWISILLGIKDAPNFISEAINENKKAYYQAIRDSRLTNNDITYFLGYIIETSTKFSLIYKNLGSIDKLMQKTGEFLSKSDKRYLKKIMLHNANDYFNYKMFNQYINNNLTKQRSSKILNDMVETNLLVKKINKRKEVAYKINPDLLEYRV